MAETTLPSVRGRSRITIGLILLLSATASGATLGFIIGVALSPLSAGPLSAGPLSAGPLSAGPLSAGLVAVLIGLSVAADVSNLLWGWPRPLSYGKQVPRQWRDLFDPRLVAGLYGARLGVGPATILSTWMWWAVSFSAGLISVWASVLVGALFGATRVASIAAVSSRAERTEHASLFVRLHEAKRTGWGSLNTIAALSCLALLLTACSSGEINDLVAEPAPASTSVTATTALELSAVESRPEPQAQEAASVTALPDPESQSSAISAISEEAPEPNPEPLAAQDLAGSLPSEVTNFVRLKDPEADRFLNFSDAVALQPDPTEEAPLLETRGFHGGWTRVFRSDTQDVIVATVYDFANSSEAAFYREDGLITLAGFGAEFFEVPSLPEARGFRTDSADEVGPLITWGLTFTHQNQWYLFYLLGDPQTATVEILTQAVARQYELLGIEG